MVELIVSPVASAAAMIVVPSMRPATMRTVRPRRRGMFRTPSLKKMRLRKAETATTKESGADDGSAVASGPVGIPEARSSLTP